MVWVQVLCRKFWNYGSGERRVCGALFSVFAGCEGLWKMFGLVFVGFWFPGFRYVLGDELVFGGGCWGLREGFTIFGFRSCMLLGVM